jgi:serine/threonine protein kinase
MLCERGRVRDFVKVLDFGLVKNVEQDSAGLTQAGALFGTPSYLSPEGIRSPDDVGAPSDIYAVGAVAYFLLTGSVPFQGESMMEVLTKHIKE